MLQWTWEADPGHAELAAAEQRLQAARPQTSPGGATPNAPLDFEEPESSPQCHSKVPRAVGRGTRADLTRLRRSGWYLLHAPRAAGNLFPTARRRRHHGHRRHLRRRRCKKSTRRDAPRPESVLRTGSHTLEASQTPPDRFSIRDRRNTATKLFSGKPGWAPSSVYIPCPLPPLPAARVRTAQTASIPPHQFL